MHEKTKTSGACKQDNALFIVTIYFFHSKWPSNKAMQTQNNQKVVLSKQFLGCRCREFPIVQYTKTVTTYFFFHQDKKLLDTFKGQLFFLH